MHIRTQLDVDVVALQTDDTVTVLLELVAPAAPEPDPAQVPAERTAVVVLDRSGSMAGPRLDAAKRALRDLVARLDDRDRFGLVVFDDQRHVEIPAERVRISADPSLIDEEPQGELDWLGGTFSMLVERGEAATARRVTSDWSRKSRGYKTRPQGGQWDVQPPSATTGDDLEEPSV
jgi:Ca-activated chloride channel family protein